MCWSDCMMMMMCVMLWFGDVLEVLKDLILGILEMFNVDVYVEKMNFGVVCVVMRCGMCGMARGLSTREGAIRARGKVLDWWLMDLNLCRGCIGMIMVSLWCWIVCVRWRSVLWGILIWSICLRTGRRILFSSFWNWCLGRILCMLLMVVLLLFSCCLVWVCVGWWWSFNGDLCWVVRCILSCRRGVIIIIFGATSGANKICFVIIRN